MLAEDLYRMGSATSSKLEKVRPNEVDLYDRNGVEMVSANGKGISLITEIGLQRRARLLSGYAWKLQANLPMPLGLALHPDQASVRQPTGAADHYLLCPAADMPLGEYVGLLQKLALKLERTHKL